MIAKVYPTPPKRLDVSMTFDAIFSKMGSPIPAMIPPGSPTEKFDDFTRFSLSVRTLLLEELLQKIPPQKMDMDPKFQVSPSNVLGTILYKAKLPEQIKEKTHHAIFDQIVAAVTRKIDSGHEYNLEKMTTELVGKIPNGFKRDLDTADATALHLAVKCYALCITMEYGKSQETEIKTVVFDGAPSASRQRSYDTIDDVAGKHSWPGSTAVKQALQEVLRTIPQMGLGEGKD
jgi:hypothetical protein